MKPLTSDTLAKAAIIEGYCWEIAALEVTNKNTPGARYFMNLADSLHRLYEDGHDGENVPSAEGLPTEMLRRVHVLRDAPPAGSPSMPPELAEVPSRGGLR